MSVPFLTTGGSFVPQAETVLFDASMYEFNDDHRWYDVRPDGDAFLFVGDLSATVAPTILVEGFLGEVRRAMEESR